MSNIDFKESDYPSVYTAADIASVKAQKNYLIFIKLDLISMIIAAFLGLLNFQNTNSKQSINLGTAILFGLALLFSAILKIFRFEKTWYGGRAVAESVKSLTWKYMIQAKPFQNMTQEKADLKFLELLSEISAEKKELSYNFDVNTKAMISQKMKDIRKLDIDIRLKLYIDKRVNAQRDWYSSKAKNNKSDGVIYSTLILILQFIMFCLSVYLIKEPTLINFNPVISSMVISFFTWMQIKKFQELSQAYSLTANELGLAVEKSIIVNDDKSLSSFVESTESAISREHTMWTARRG